MWMEKLTEKFPLGRSNTLLLSMSPMKTVLVITRTGTEPIKILTEEAIYLGRMK